MPVGTGILPFPLYLARGPWGNFRDDFPTLACTNTLIPTTDFLLMGALSQRANAANPVERNASRFPVDTGILEKHSLSFFLQTECLVMVTAPPETMEVGTRIPRHQPLIAISSEYLKHRSEFPSGETAYRRFANSVQRIT